jgi:hypothetical protein
MNLKEGVYVITEDVQNIMPDGRSPKHLDKAKVWFKDTKVYVFEATDTLVPRIMPLTNYTPHRSLNCHRRSSEQWEPLIKVLQPVSDTLGNLLVKEMGSGGWIGAEHVLALLIERGVVSLETVKDTIDWIAHEPTELVEDLFKKHDVR